MGKNCVWFRIFILKVQTVSRVSKYFNVFNWSISELKVLDLLRNAISKDLGESKLSAIRVDGGMAASNWTMQMLSELVELPVDRPKNLETTALGAAYLAGMQVGFYPSMDEFSETWQSESQFNSKMTNDQRQRKLSGWEDAVKRTLSDS